MDIKYIKTIGLFGKFDHTIKFSDGVNIIIGDNGVGKTVCLKILNSIFNKDFGYFFHLEFQEIIISFGKEIWTISREKIQEETLFSYDDQFDTEQYNLVIESNIINRRHVVKKEDVLINLPSFFERISDNEWYDRRRGVYCDEKDLLNRYSIRKETRNLPIWIVKRIMNISVRMIDTQRIYRNETNGRRAEIGRTISKYVKEVSEIIRKEQNKAGVIAAELDSSFPTRLIKELSSPQKEITPKTTLNQLYEIDAINHSLRAVGLIDYKKESILKNLQLIDKPILSVLSLYADDMKTKLEAYKGIQSKLQLFLDIINNRFANKQCVLNKECEFEIVTSVPVGNLKKYKKIEPTLLSSGEQNEFVLFYELLFKCDKKNFILIDEPELSLHIKWQQMMIDDLQRICEQNNLNILIATHSPDLIGNHWSLVQKLQ